MSNHNTHANSRSKGSGSRWRMALWIGGVLISILCIQQILFNHALRREFLKWVGECDSASIARLLELHCPPRLG